MEDQFTYQDFDLLIEPDPPGGYRARALRSPAGESAAVQFTLPFSPMELENFALRVGRPRRATRGPGRPETAPLKDFGAKLYNAVFQNELRDTLVRSISLTSTQGAGLRLRLRLTDTPELAELPWEFIYDPRHSRFLAQSRRTPLVRYLDLPDPPHPLAVDGPLRLLVMVSSPATYPELNVEQEWRLLTEALTDQLEEGRVIVERLEANMGMLRRRLRREAFHMFHFIGHGHFRPDWGDGVLVMEDAVGRPHEVTGEELGGLLNEYDPTRLAVLNACEGARNDASDPFAGVAQSLIQQGLPAVVAMQYEITDDAAIIFARELYGAIADGLQLEAALAEARGAIRDEGNPTEWGTPVLYSRAPDGRLFDLARQSQIVEVERQVSDESGGKLRMRAEAAEKFALAEDSEDRGDTTTAAQLREQAGALLEAAEPIASEYRNARLSMPEGRERTRAMESIMDRARELAGQGAFQPSEIISWLRDGSDEQRIIALAMMQAQPTLREFDALLATIKDPRSAFEQYHAMLLAKQMLDDLDVEQRQSLAEVLKDEQSMRFPFDRGRRRLSQAILDSSETYLNNT
jgi:CHAT domain